MTQNPSPTPIRYEVRSGSISTELGCLGDVRFTPDNNHTADIPVRQLRARKRHCQPSRFCAGQPEPATDLRALLGERSLFITPNASLRARSVQRLTPKELRQ